MQNQFSRTQMLLGKEAIEKLSNSRVAVFGVGGVGGYAVEVLARSGVGTIDLIDSDCVCVTNINRQIIATLSTVGRYKVDVAEERIHDINENCVVNKFNVFYLPEKANLFDFSKYDYVVDCIDTVSAKLDLIRRCHSLGVPIISCMGAAFKMDATQFAVTDIKKTINDPLARVIRTKLRKEGIRSLKVVYSPEVPVKNIEMPDAACQFLDTCPRADVCQNSDVKPSPGSNAWVPATAGLIAGGEVVKDLLKLL